MRTIDLEVLRKAIEDSLRESLSLLHPWLREYCRHKNPGSERCFFFMEGPRVADLCIDKSCPALHELTKE